MQDLTSSRLQAPSLISCGGQEKINHLPLLIRCPIIIGPSDFDFNLAFIHSPPITATILFSSKNRFQIRYIMKNPAINSAVLNREATFLHQFFDVPATEGVGQIPTIALQDHVVLKMSAFERCGCHDGFPSNSLRRPHHAFCNRTRISPPLACMTAGSRDRRIARSFGSNFEIVGMIEREWNGLQ